MIEQKFVFSLPVDIIKKSDEEWRIAGVASTENKDFQGEVIKIDGLDISTLEKNGFFNEDHRKGFQNILGKIDKAEKRDDDKAGKHLYVEGRLFKTQPGAQAAWNIMNELEKSNDLSKRMQLSVEGKIFKRAGKDKKTIVKAKAENVALTLNPINDHTFASMLKSMEVLNQVEEIKETDLEKAKSKLSEEEIHEKIIKFFQINPNPNDPQVHTFADELGLDEGELERHIYMLFTKYVNKESTEKVKKAEPDFMTEIFRTTFNSLVQDPTLVRKGFKDSLIDLLKGRSKEEVKEALSIISKALTATHSYATQLPQERTGGDVMTQESLDRKKRKKEKVKEFVNKMSKSFPLMSSEKILKLVIDRIKERRI